MKSTIYLFTLLLVFSACHKKTTVVTKTTTSTTTITKEEPKKVEESIEEQMKNEKHPNEGEEYYKMVQKKLSEDAVARIQKTACFGRCPIYTMTVYKDGRVEYFGKKFVEKEGRYTAKADQALIAELLEKAEKTEFFQFNDVYDKEAITDLPSVITSIKGEEGFKTVVNRFNGPKELAEFQNYFEAAFEKLKWTKVN